MARPRQPADLVKARGRSHLSKREYEEKKGGELNVPSKSAPAPVYLTTKKQVAEFDEIAAKLVSLNIFTELDVDALGRYVLSKELYLTYTKKLKAMLRDETADLRNIESLQRMQDKAYRQCVTSANELCLNITSRAKLVIPTPTDDGDDEL